MPRHPSSYFAHTSCWTVWPAAPAKFVKLRDVKSPECFTAVSQRTSFVIRYHQLHQSGAITQQHLRARLTSNILCFAWEKTKIQSTWRSHVSGDRLVKKKCILMRLNRVKPDLKTSLFTRTRSETDEATQLWKHSLGFILSAKMSVKC